MFNHLSLSIYEESHSKLQSRRNMDNQSGHIIHNDKRGFPKLKYHHIWQALLVNSV